MKTVAVALSGGVDSAASAYILKNKGYNVFGITMKLFDNQDVESAAYVAEKLGIDHHIVDLTDTFETDVIDIFINEYLKGKTPNPCIICNKKIKYGLLLDKAISLGADYMALGHYAKIEYDANNDRYRLYKASANRKDQSYFLHHLSQEQLSKIILPLSDFENKDEVRKIVLELIPDISQKKDSTDICFTNGMSPFNYIKKRKNLVNTSGNFISKDGKFLGKHRGIFNYTIGQKRGLELKTDKTYFILRFNNDTNEIVLTDNENDLYANEITLSDVRYTDKSFYDKERITATVKLCVWGNFSPCEIINLKDRTAKVVFNSPERAPASGQSAVFYDGDEVLGGGIID